MEERPLSFIIREFLDGFKGLLRGEIRLAKAEASQNARDAIRQFAQIGFATAMATLGALVLLAFAVIGIGTLLDGRFWLSSLIVGSVLFFPGLILMLVSMRKVRIDASLPQLRDNLEEDTAMFRSRVRSLSETRPGQIGPETRLSA